MNKKYITNVRHNMNRAEQERKDREIIKGDLLVMCVALAAILICIVII
jgi:hypothetical protein